ncbi:MAG: F0F1 ATP synthase subunit B [Candidatus Ozemobacteraceae bacterium]
MLINWFTVGAQIVNFLILVWLLKRFLYKPILHAMEERQLQIAAILHDAENTKSSAENERRILETSVEAFEQERMSRLKLLEQEMETRKKQMTDNLRGEMDTLRLRWQESLEQEQKSMQNNLSVLIQQELFALVRKLLQDLADTSLEEQMIAVFLLRLKNMSVQEREKFTLLLGDPSTMVLIKTAFDLSPASREKFLLALGKDPLHSEGVTFQRAPEMICGIELLVGGVKISWTATEYSASLEGKIRNSLEQEKHAQS